MEINRQQVTRRKLEIISYRLVFIVQVATPEVSRFGEVESREDQIENRLSWEVILGVEKNYFIELSAFSFSFTIYLNFVVELRLVQENDSDRDDPGWSTQAIHFSAWSLFSAASG